jgi:NADH-quinone oxidoreductase subunit N
VTGLRGLAETQPFLALVIMVSLFSFAGLPFFAGFATKMFLFQAATSNELIWLVALGVINSFISLYYYLMIVRQMYLFDPIRGMKRFRVNPLMWGLGAALMIGVFFIGIYPGPVFKGATKAATPLFQIGADATNSNAAANIEVTH